LPLILHGLTRYRSALCYKLQMQLSLTVAELAKSHDMRNIFFKLKKIILDGVCGSGYVSVERLGVPRV